MAFSSTQRKALAGIRKLINSSEWADVGQGLALLHATDDPALWALLAEGIRFSAEGRLVLGAGEIKKRVKKDHRVGVALAAARQVGLLESLTRLDLSGTGVQDLQPLRGLVNLTTLDLSACSALKDLRPLRGLVNLKTLNLIFEGWDSNNVLTSLDGLEGMTRLTTLTLHHCKALRDLRALKGLSSLTTLTLRDCLSISDLSGIEGLASLEELTLSGCYGVVKLQPISGRKSLHTLDLSYCAVRGLRDLKDLPSLMRLRLGSCKRLGDISGIEAFTSLERLSLYSCESLTDLKPLQGLTNLIDLDLSYCRAISDLSGLEGLVNLIKLDLYECVALQNLQALRPLEGLSMRFGHPGMKDLSPLKELTLLTVLHLNHGMSWSYRFANVGLTDLSPLKGLSGLTLLTLGYCKNLSDAEVDALCQALPDCEIMRRKKPLIFADYTDAQLLALGASRQQLGRVRLVSTDRQMAALQDVISAATLEALQYLRSGIDYSEVFKVYQESTTP